MLLDHGYLREQEPIPRAGRGRKPSQVYLLNPLGQNGQNGQNGFAPQDEELERYGQEFTGKDW
jgi:hypothetical protein